MTPTEAAHLLEPLWLGLLASRVRVQEAAKAAEGLKGREAQAALNDLQQAAYWLEELGRRFGVEGIQHTVWLTPEGDYLGWPSALEPDAQREANRRYLETRKEAQDLLAGKGAVTPFRQGAA